MKWLMYLKFLCLIGLTGFLIYCGTQPAPDPEVRRSAPDRSNSYYDKANKREGRDSALNRAKKRYTGPKCEGDDDCEDICQKLYRNKVRDECEELSIEQVEILKNIDEVFENPTERELEDIDSYDFETYVNIDLAPFDKRVSKFSSTESKRVLSWILENQDIGEIFRNADNDYDLLEEILKGLNSDIKLALTKSITGSDSFIELAITEGDENFKWIHDYFGEECSDNDDQEVCVLQEWYCEFNLSGDNWDNLLGNDEFEPVIKEILSEYECPACAGHAADKPGGTAISWWTEDVEGVNDVPEPENLDNLCPPRVLARRN